MTPSASVTVYLGSSGYCRDFYNEQAAALGAALADGDCRLVYGGMDAGLMGILANAVMERSGNVLGIVPRKIKDIRRFHKHLSEHILVDTLWERKRLLFEHGDVLAVFPGGFGTLDEALEVIYWARLGLHAKPVVFVNPDGYWDNALAHLRGLPDLPPETFSAVKDAGEVVALAKESVSSGRVRESFDRADLPHFEDEIVRPTKTPVIIDETGIEQTYRLITALGLKQVGAHDRPVGLLNRDGSYDSLLAWIIDAAREKFITDKCPDLMVTAKTEQDLMAALENIEHIVIDLVKDKWGVAADAMDE
jgi:hypothetical protein